MATKLIKNTYAKKALKEHSGASQVGEDALERLDELFAEFLTKVATAASKSLEKDERSKVAAEDVDFGYQEILGESNVPPEPARFIESLHKMDLLQLGEVLRLIVDWNETEGRQRRKKR